MGATMGSFCWWYFVPELAMVAEGWEFLLFMGREYVGIPRGWSRGSVLEATSIVGPGWGSLSACKLRPLEFPVFFIIMIHLPNNVRWDKSGNSCPFQRLGHFWTWNSLSWTCKHIRRKIREERQSASLLRRLLSLPSLVWGLWSVKIVLVENREISTHFRVSVKTLPWR